MSIYVIRHAEKESGEFFENSLRLNNPPLSARGKRQALNLEKYFQNIKIDEIYISEYIRTRQTITHVAQSKNIPPTIDKRLNEIDNGNLDRLTDKEISETYPEFWKAYLAREADFRFPNGETGEEAGTRIFEFFNTLDPLKNSIVVAHDGIIRLLICKVLSLPTYKRHMLRVSFCSITTFEFNNEFNCWTVPQINFPIDG
jgi:probable phosphoglycerate mutase